MPTPQTLFLLSHNLSPLLNYPYHIIVNNNNQLIYTTL
jgi:hypothetical protein